MVVHSDAERAVDEARARFRRTLCAWAVDVLELRRRGLHRPVMRPGRDGPHEPAGVAPLPPPSPRPRRDTAHDEVSL